MKSKLLILSATFAAIGVIALNLTACKKKSTPGPPEVTKVKAWAVGDQDTITKHGMILRTEDGGESWVRQGKDSPALQGVDVNDLVVLDSVTVLAVCTHNTLIRTTDGGLTWNQVPTPANPFNPALSSISLLDGNTIWISGYNGVVYKSTDSGNSWTVFDPNLFFNGYMQGIHAITADLVYVAGQYDAPHGKRGIIALTRNAGNSWDTISLMNNYNQWWWIGAKATSPNNVIVFGQKGHYSISHDNGSSWQNDSITKSEGAPQDINCLVMVTPQVFWCACDDDVYKTTDGGNTWEMQLTKATTLMLVGIDAINDQFAMIVWQCEMPQASTIQKTTDGGKTWTVKYETGFWLHKIAFVH